MTSDPNVSEEGMELFFTYCSPNALLMTAAIFLLVRKVRITSPVICRALANLTKCGFGLYCVHYFFVGPYSFRWKAIYGDLFYLYFCVVKHNYAILMRVCFA